MKKNLCIVVYDISDMGGTNQVASSLCRSFLPYYNITVLSIRKSRDTIPHPFPDGVEVTFLFKSTVNVRDTVKRCFFPAHKYFKRNKTDAAILIGHYAGFIIGVLQPFVRTRLVFCDHGALVNQWDEKEERLMRRIGTKLCKRVVTLTERTRDDYIRLFHIPKKKIECIYNWIEYDTERAYTYTPEVKSIMWAGRFSPEKGNDMMYDVARRVLKKNPDWRWDVYGDGDTLDYYREKCLDDGLDRQLHFPGRTLKLNEKYREHAILTLTSYREGLPLVLLEAKANDVPVVAFDVVTGPAEIVRDGIDGVLVEPKNTALMAEKLDFLMNNPDELSRMSRNAREGLAKFSKPVILEKWINLINSL